MYKSKKSFLKEENLLVLMSLNNFIIPEIQREYVWGENENVIVPFLKEIKNKMGKFCKSSYLPLENNKINIGFLYSYKPNYINPVNERFIDENLIDGQQRFTTLFLLLFYTALKENRKQDFLSLLRFDDARNMCFNFQVREATRKFLLELVEKVDNIDQIHRVEEQTWFLKDYESDPSIKSMQKAIGYIKEIYTDQNRYYNHLLTNIVFWHFKTEATSQGEELYITMNARGETLTDNEITKALLMIDGKDQFKWGKKWEEWQNFFWKHKKNGNANADNGFNEFLRWVQILKMIESTSINLEDENEETADKKEIIEVLKWEKNSTGKNNKTTPVLNKKWFEFEEVNGYFKSINYIFTVLTEFSLHEYYPGYDNSDLIDENWLSPGINIKMNGNSVLNQIDLFILLPVIQFHKRLSEKGIEFSDQDVYRFTRFFYNVRKFDNVEKSVNALIISAIKTVNTLVEDGYTDITDLLKVSKVSKTYLTNEEKYKLEQYVTPPPDTKREDLESLFWKLEDHKLNNGEIGHLIQLSEQVDKSILRTKYNESHPFKVGHVDFENLDKVSDQFLELIPLDGKITNRLWGNFIPTSLYLVPDWDKRRILRNTGKENRGVVRNSDFLKMVFQIDNLDLDEFLTKREKDIFKDYKLEDLYVETDRKVQLLAYFVIMSQKKCWEWGKGGNFGSDFYADEKNWMPLFENKLNFQHFQRAWHYSIDRFVNFSVFSDGKDYLKELIEWAKS